MRVILLCEKPATASLLRVQLEGVLRGTGGDAASVTVECYTSSDIRVAEKALCTAEATNGQPAVQSLLFTDVMHADFSCMASCPEHWRIVGLGKPVQEEGGEWIGLPVNKQTLRRIVAGGPVLQVDALYAELTVQIADSLETLLSSLSEAYGQGDLKQAGKHAHSIKGIGMSFNVAELTMAATELEHGLERNSSAAVQAACRALGAVAKMLRSMPKTH